MNMFKCFDPCSTQRSFSTFFISQITVSTNKSVKTPSHESWLMTHVIPDLYLKMASAGCQRPRRPGFSNSLFLFWESWFLSQMFAHQARRPWTKTRTCVMIMRTGTRDSKIQARTQTSLGALIWRWLFHQLLNIKLFIWTLKCKIVIFAHFLV